MVDSQFCRRCGQPRPVHAALSRDNCRQCQTSFARDASYCRMCGTQRPRSSNTPRYVLPLAQEALSNDKRGGVSGLARGFRRISTPFDLRTLMRIAAPHKYENNISAMHFFLVNCEDLDGETLLEIHHINPTVLSMTSSLMRTPVHHMMERREGNYRADILIAIQECHAGSFCRRDIYKCVKKKHAAKYCEHTKSHTPSPFISTPSLPPSLPLL